MYCGYCGNIIPKEQEENVTVLVGRGTEVKTSKTFSFKYTLCSECNARIDSNLDGGEEKALRRKYEMELFDKLLTPAEIDEELRKFDTKTFGVRM